MRNEISIELEVNLTEVRSNRKVVLLVTSYAHLKRKNYQYSDFMLHSHE